MNKRYKVILLLSLSLLLTGCSNVHIGGSGGVGGVKGHGSISIPTGR